MTCCAYISRIWLEPTSISHLNNRFSPTLNHFVYLCWINCGLLQWSQKRIRKNTEREWRWSAFAILKRLILTYIKLYRCWLTCFEKRANRDQVHVDLCDSKTKPLVNYFIKILLKTIFLKQREVISRILCKVVVSKFGKLIYLLVLIIGPKIKLSLFSNAHKLFISETFVGFNSFI